jgi:dethiobiotin synthetase
MSRIRPRGLFITGTDTNVGKTHVASCLARSLRANGIRVGVYKPAASGCEFVNGELQSDDAVALWEAAGRPGTLSQVCPQRFAAPLAPHLAARAEGHEINSRALRTGLDYWRDNSDFVIVEGAGGLLSPLGDQEYVADLAIEFGYPLLIVAPNVLGVINQTLQTLLVARTYRGGLNVAGVVLNDVRPLRPDLDPSVVGNRTELERHASAPIVAGLGHGANEFDREIRWETIGGE